jgi:3-dehydroquinate synthase
MIDAAIGVKTAVNYQGRKSAIGTYYPPAGVLVDPSFLTTLSRRELASGLAEAIKIAVVADAELFELLETRSATIGDAVDGTNARELIAGCITALLPELADNLWETQLERLADFGHTFSPALEMAAAGRLLHGEAVALDMALSIELAEGRGYIDGDTGARVRGLLSDAGLPLLDDLMTEERLWRGLGETTRHRGGLQRLPLPVAIGSAAFVSDIGREELGRALARLGRHQEEAHA